MIHRTNSAKNLLGFPLEMRHVLYFLATALTFKVAMKIFIA